MSIVANLLTTHQSQLMEWVGDVKASTLENGRIAELFFEFTTNHMLKEPEVRTYQVIGEGETVDRTDTVKSRTQIISGVIKVEEESNIEAYNFAEEIESVTKFIRGSKSFTVNTTLKACNISGQTLASKTFSIQSNDC